MIPMHYHQLARQVHQERIDAALRRGLLREPERSPRNGQSSRISRLARGWLAKTFSGLAARVDPSATPSTATSPR